LSSKQPVKLTVALHKTAELWCQDNPHAFDQVFLHREGDGHQQGKEASGMTREKKQPLMKLINPHGVQLRQMLESLQKVA
jgi:hypothetical protein